MRTFKPNKDDPIPTWSFPQGVSVAYGRMYVSFNKSDASVCVYHRDKEGFLADLDLEYEITEVELDLDGVSSLRQCLQSAEDAIRHGLLDRYLVEDMAIPDGSIKPPVSASYQGKPIFDHEDNRSFKENLSKSPSSLEMVDKDLADLIGVSRPTVTRWRNGKCAPHPLMRKLVYETLARYSSDQQVTLREGIVFYPEKPTRARKALSDYPQPGPHYVPVGDPSADLNSPIFGMRGGLMCIKYEKPRVDKSKARMLGFIYD